MLGFSLCFPPSFFCLLEEETYTLIKGNDSQRSQTDFDIHSRVQHCLREYPLVAEAVKLLKASEGTIRRTFTLSMHFDNLIFFTQ